MKRLLCIIILAVCLTACKKDNNDLLQNDPANSKFSIDNLSPIPVPTAYTWTRLANPDVPNSDPGGINVVIPVNGAVYCIKGFYHFRTLYKLNINTKKWSASNDFEIDAESQYLFSYGTKIYFGMMQTNADTYKAMHSIDVVTSVKTNLANFPSEGLNHPTTFVIGNKGYLMGGTTYGGTLNSHIYEYNFSTNQWTDKGNNPFGIARGGASAYVIGNKAYLGLGYTRFYLNGQQLTVPKNDWILYDPATNLSIVKTDFPGQKRYDAEGFIMNNNIYLGFGYSNGYFTDFWKYNTSNNAWSQQDGWPGNIVSGNNYFGTFSLGNTGYMVKGDLAEFWKFSNSPYAIQ